MEHMFRRTPAGFETFDRFSKCVFSPSFERPELLNLDDLERVSFAQRWDLHGWPSPWVRWPGGDPYSCRKPTSSVVEKTMKTPKPSKCVRSLLHRPILLVSV